MKENIRFLTIPISFDYGDVSSGDFMDVKDGLQTLLASHNIKSKDPDEFIDEECLDYGDH